MLGTMRVGKDIMTESSHGQSIQPRARTICNSHATVVQIGVFLVAINFLRSSQMASGVISLLSFAEISIYLKFVEDQ